MQYFLDKEKEDVAFLGLTDGPRPNTWNGCIGDYGLLFERKDNGVFRSKRATAPLSLQGNYSVTIWDPQSTNLGTFFPCVTLQFAMCIAIAVVDQYAEDSEPYKQLYDIL